MIKISIPTKEQIYGENQFKILREKGRECASTDYVICSGAYIAKDYYTPERKSLNNRRCVYFLKDSKNNLVNVVGFVGPESYNSNDRFVSVRPILLYSSIFDIFPNGINKNKDEIDYGEYAETIVNKVSSNKLEDLYQNGSLQIVGHYTIF